MITQEENDFLYSLGFEFVYYGGYLRQDNRYEFNLGELNIQIRKEMDTGMWFGQIWKNLSVIKATGGISVEEVVTKLME